MDTPPSRKSHVHVLTWAVTILVVVPVLYLLSVPPVVYGMFMHRLTAPSTYLRPEWAYVYARPYHWISSNTPLRGPLSAYDEYWQKMLLPRFPGH